MVYILEVLSKENLELMRINAMNQWRNHFNELNVIQKTIDELNDELDKRK